MKKFLFIVIISSLIIYYIFCPNYVSQSCKIGVMLWFNQIFPTLFIFTIISNVVISSNIIEEINDKYICLINYCLGLILGFPIGAKIAGDLYNRKLLSADNALSIAALSNFFSLPFVLCYAINLNLEGKNSNIVLISLYLPTIIMFIFFLIRRKIIQQKNKASRFKINIQIIDAGIINGFETLIKLCGYIVLFSVIARIPEKITYNDTNILRYIFAYIEATNGIKSICSLNIGLNEKTIICTSILAFGGLSSIVQTKAILNDKKLQIKNYIIIKIQLALISTGICYVLLQIF